MAIVRTAVLAAGLVLALPAGAQAAQTFGSSLTEPANYFTACNADPDPPEVCTVLQTAAPNSTLASPIDGVVTRWRVRSISGGTVTLRILRPNADGSFTAIGGSLPESLTQRTTGGADATYTFPTRIPVVTGDRIAVDRDRKAGGIYRKRDDPAFQTGVFVPPLNDFDTGTPDQGEAGVEVMVSADVEPDADADGYGDETQDNCPQIPNDQSSNPCPPTNAGAPGTGTSGGDTGAGAPRPFFRHHRVRHGVKRATRTGRATDVFRRHRRR